VPKGEAHVVVSPKKTFVCSGNPNFQRKHNKASYFAIPDWLPGVGRTIKTMDLTVKELKLPQETYEKGQARYEINTSTKFRIIDVDIAAETISSEEDLRQQLDDVIKAGVREVTVQYDVVNARAKKLEMETEIRKSITDDFAKWGLELVNFQLVDFQDTDESNIISDISKVREKEIEANRRQQNAEKDKQAREKEAEADEAARTREIQRDKVVGQKQMDKEKEVADRQKIAKESQYEVIRVQEVKKADIEREKSVVLANKEREVEEITKEKKKLEGEGDRLQQEEQAKGEAAPIREKGFAEAEAKEKLQAALNKFEDKAIRALIAEIVVEKDKAIGVETAKSLSTADLKVFAGGGEGKAGFDLGQLLGALKTSGDKMDVNALLNRIARPNDAGVKVNIGDKNINEVTEEKPKPVKNPKTAK
jgi:flotillin